MRAAKYDLWLEQGATFSQRFVWVDSTGAEVDLDGLDFEMHIRATKDSAATILEGAYDGGTDTPSGDIVFQEWGVNGMFSITIPDTVLEDISFTQGVYDLEVSTGSETWRLLEGVVRFSKEVTRG